MLYNRYLVLDTKFNIFNQNILIQYQNIEIFKFITLKIINVLFYVTL